jgi:3-hydroxy-9,10-secoandrosta-1,3,5(10)-triene-9,17-dione monooxygenase reductase component
MNRPASIDSREFRSALGAFTTGVTIVTARAPDGTRVGVTANSFNSVSLNPPMILWSLAKSARSLASFEVAQYWVVHILAANQDELSTRFARSGGDKFAGLETETGLGETPLLKSCACRLQCKTAFRYEGGDHVIFVGEVVAFDRNDIPPLVFHDGQYALATRKAEPTLLSGNSPRDSDISYGEDFLGYLLWRAYLHFRNRVIVPLNARGLDPDTFMILALLLHRDGRSPEQLSSGLRQLGSQAVTQHLEVFRARGWVRTEGEAPASRVWLTDSGREVVLHIHAASKSIEADLLERLAGGEALALKHLLRRFILQTDGGMPHPWQEAEAPGTQEPSNS